VIKRDGIQPLRDNKYFRNAEHILGDIKDVNGKDYKRLIKYQNPEKLILIGK
jgi:hypothetical protein